MKRILACGVSLMVVLAAGMSLAAKGATTKITISGGNLAAPIEITDATIVQHF